MEWELLRNLILQWLEDNLESLKLSTEEVIEKVLEMLEENGYEITPEVIELVNSLVERNVNFVKGLIEASSLRVGKFLGFDDRLRQEVLEEIEKYEYPDGLNLSKRLWKRKRELKEIFKSVLFQSIKLREGARKIAYEFQYEMERLTDEEFVNLVKEGKPKHIRELEEIARKVIKGEESYERWKKVIEKYERYIEERSRLGTYFGHKTLLRELTKAVEELSDKAVKDAVKWWAYDKQLYYLSRIARTEVSNVMHLSIIKKTEKNPLVVGYKWRLSPAHARADICDVYANVDFGLGRGVWPKDRVPRRKAHPHCTCLLIPVSGLKKEYKDRSLKEMIRENPQGFEEWLKTRKWAWELYKAGVPIEEFFDEKGLRLKTRREMKEWIEKKELVKVLGAKRKAGVKVGDEVIHPIHGFKTKVVAIYEDLLGNERVLTEHAKRHVEEEASTVKGRKWQRELRRKALSELGNILAEPDTILEDRKYKAFIYVKRYGKYYLGAVVGKENPAYIYTVQPMSENSINRGERYIKLYERKTKT
ncbi:MAG: hypothetical protein DSY42_06925 [Aquifex sp.]|nr:MAG: hypothetical protein DSY42_06925 [Aquifex sp.]